MDQKWNKYEYVCSYCDSAITFVTTITQDQMLCPVCFNGYATLLSVVDATINTNNETKEVPPMNATTEFLQSQIDDLKSQLTKHQNCDYWKSENGRIQGQLIQLIDQAYSDSEETVSVTDLCQIIDYNPVKEIEFTATMSFTGRIEIPMNEADDFDLEQALEDAYVDINNGNVVIDSYELYDANEC